jgi:hypothetical protein
MFSRLGHVIGWVANLFAAFLIFGGVVELLGYTSDPPDKRLSFFWFTAASAFAIFLIGRAVRYILAGSKGDDLISLVVRLIPTTCLLCERKRARYLGPPAKAH